MLIHFRQIFRHVQDENGDKFVECSKCDSIGRTSGHGEAVSGRRSLPDTVRPTDLSIPRTGERRTL